MEHAEVLVSLRHADGIAGVVLIDGEPCLSGYIGGAATALDDFQGRVEGLTGDRTAEGGRLPPGAVSAEVRDRTGARRVAAADNGAWVIVLDQPTFGTPSPVVFFDSSGRVVRRPLPPNWPRQPVLSSEQCPACGARGWEEVRPLDGSRGLRGVATGGYEPTPIVVCTTCEYEEIEGAMAVAHLEVRRRSRPVRPRAATATAIAELGIAGTRGSRGCSIPDTRRHRMAGEARRVQFAKSPDQLGDRGASSPGRRP